VGVLREINFIKLRLQRLFKLQTDETTDDDVIMSHYLNLLKQSGTEQDDVELGMQAVHDFGDRANNRISVRNVTSDAATDIDPKFNCSSVSPANHDDFEEPAPNRLKVFVPFATMSEAFDDGLKTRGAGVHTSLKSAMVASVRSMKKFFARDDDEEVTSFLPFVDTVTIPI
jgi:hypothetical protein